MGKASREVFDSWASFFAFFFVCLWAWILCVVNYWIQYFQIPPIYKRMFDTVYW